MFKIKITSKKSIILGLLVVGFGIIILVPNLPRKANLNDSSSINTKDNISDEDTEPPYTGPMVAPLNLGDKSIEFSYTDNLDNESLIIKSDQADYTGDSGSDVYFSVTNTSTSNLDESTILLFYFPGQFIPNRNDPPGTEPATVTSLEQRQGNSWQKLKFFSKNIKIDNKSLGKALAKRKPIPEDFVVKAATQVEIPAGQTLYFKSQITYRSVDSGEFWIEALGQNGGYGLLDPTYKGTRYGSITSNDSVVSWFASGSQTWSFRKKISINKNKVAGGANLSNFPVLFNVTDSTLATTANSGKAASGSGEFVFTSSDGTTVLPHEIESYTATTGQLIAWINVTTLSVKQDTNLYIYYGGPAAGTKTNQRKQATWNSNYLGVWHLPDGSTLTAQDSTSNAKNGTLTNTPTATEGKVDGGANLVKTSIQYVALGNGINPTAVTYSAWVKATTLPAVSNAVIVRNVDAAVISGLFVKNTGKLYVDVTATGDVQYNGTGSNRLSTGVWYYVAFSYDSSNGLLGYVNGISDNTVGANGTLNTTTTTLRIGSDAGITSREWNGVIDEARISKTARTAGWIATEYNNQSLPNSFYSLGGLEAKTKSTPGLKYGSITSNDSVVSWFASGSQTWSFRKKISINKNKVAGGANLSNFPVLFNVTDSTLATTANSGKAASGSGEFVFTSSDGTTVLPHEIESYTATTGQLIAWINVTTLSVKQDTNLYIYYGGPAAGTKTNQRKQATWNSNYLGVWHLPDGTTLGALDSTSGSNNGTITGAKAVTGKVDGAGSFDGVDDKLDMGNVLSNTGQLTISAWIYVTGTVNTYQGVIIKGVVGRNYSLAINATKMNRVWTQGITSANNPQISITLDTNTWYHMTAVRNVGSGGATVYVNGISSFNDAGTGGATNTEILGIGIGGSGFGYFTGFIDEARISATALTANWITTEYNNQSLPSTFYSLGGLEAKTKSTPGLKIR